MVSSDPLDALSLGLVSIEPRPRFAAELLHRIRGGEDPMPTTISTVPSVTPALHYWNADAALVWLTDVLGLSESWVRRSEQGKVHHAELQWGAGLVSINYKRGRYEQYGPATVCLLAAERAQVDAVYHRAAAAGADVVHPPREDPTGYSFAARDPEGDLWQVGTDTLDTLREGNRAAD